MIHVQQRQFVVVNYGQKVYICVRVCERETPLKGTNHGLSSLEL